MYYVIKEIYQYDGFILTAKVQNFQNLLIFFSKLEYKMYEKLVTIFPKICAIIFD